MPRRPRAQGGKRSVVNEGNSDNCQVYCTNTTDTILIGQRLCGMYSDDVRSERTDGLERKSAMKVVLISVDGDDCQKALHATEPWRGRGSVGSCPGLSPVRDWALPAITCRGWRLFTTVDHLSWRCPTYNPGSNGLWDATGVSSENRQRRDNLVRSGGSHLCTATGNAPPPFTDGLSL